MFTVFLKSAGKTVEESSVPSSGMEIQLYGWFSLRFLGSYLNAAYLCVPRNISLISTHQNKKIIHCMPLVKFGTHNVSFCSYRGSKVNQ